MALASYALTSATVFLLVFVLWQVLVGRAETDPDERRAAFRAARLFAAGAAVTAVAAILTRLLV